MRLLVILFWLAVAAVVLVALLRGRGPQVRRARGAPSDELVKDPVCETYVVKSRAVRRADGDTVRYFCSDECARRAAGR